MKCEARRPLQRSDVVFMCQPEVRGICVLCRLASSKHPMRRRSGFQQVEDVYGTKVERMTEVASSLTKCCRYIYSIFSELPSQQLKPLKANTSSMSSCFNVIGPMAQR